MKAIVCGLCADVRALRGEGEKDAVTCECGNVTGWWKNARSGSAVVRATNRDKAKILGIHNGILLAAFSAYDFSAEKWKRTHDDLVKESDGYVFKGRGCPFAIVAIGNTIDTRWASV